MLFAKFPSKNYKIGVFLAYLLLIVNIKNFFILFGLILKLAILNYGLLTIALISFFIIFWIYFIANALNLPSFFECSLNFR